MAQVVHPAHDRLSDVRRIGPLSPLDGQGRERRFEILPEPFYSHTPARETVLCGILVDETLVGPVRAAYLVAVRAIAPSAASSPPKANGQKVPGQRVAWQDMLDLTLPVTRPDGQLDRSRPSREGSNVSFSPGCRETGARLQREFYDQRRLLERRKEGSGHHGCAKGFLGTVQPTLCPIEARTASSTGGICKDCAYVIVPCI
ncbi:hypothetical protein B2J93_4820 [Marssonina coronariae]|uniref:Uncharacterized protein n=1 Tax=Diplocarpon coronariae TaxID=2795749 RepID=A0A218YZI3_9HELO|nr:hypothetical protein B2J93_4820 [Marssonina coronariae]